MAEAFVERLAGILKIRVNVFLRHTEHAELFEDVRLGFGGNADEADLRDAERRRGGVVVVG